MNAPVSQITFVDRNESVVEAFREAFSDVPEANFHAGDFAEVDFDAIVSPANSFGLMDGGFDAALTRKYGLQLQYRVQAHIARKFAGMQPVGTAFIVPLMEERVVGHPTTPRGGPWLVHAPTMRVPVDIRGTDNVYAAFKAILLATRDDIGLGWAQSQRRLATPGLGTLTGRVAAKSAAEQMRYAWNHVAHTPNQASDLTWAFATGRDSVLQFLARGSEPTDSPQPLARLAGFSA